VSQTPVGIMIQTYANVVFNTGLIENYFFCKNPDKALLADG
jgi:hypothetical protein